MLPMRSRAVAVLRSTQVPWVQRRFRGAPAGPEPPGFVSSADFARTFASSEAPRQQRRTSRGFRKFSDWGVCGRGKVRQRLTQSDPALCGEDSFFVSDAHVHTLGVADGVGGWRDAGIDPGEIARGLMHNAKSLSDSKYILPHWLLAEAYWKLKYRGEVGAGSTTACIVCVRDTVSRASGVESHRQMLFSANLGDSGWILLRKGKAVEVANSQRLTTNTPKQLAIIPPTLAAEGYINNEPYDAAISTHEVWPGDVIVLATDGLWDNLDIPQVEQVVQQNETQRMDVLARTLTEKAAFRPRKPDDVTIVTAMV
eukprot:TRINITY_DN6715_c0_g1_i1.p2 TRINITY_DN6715_c0_g1~~TRINITY_DN6715_c0_g1_i1.p2  ORF type:complete len:312 (+),score=19.59 TRINITY_DN6715_c0_g1_i1:245-1180(+)